MTLRKRMKKNFRAKQLCPKLEKGKLEFCKCGCKCKTNNNLHCKTLGWSNF